MRGGVPMTLREFLTIALAPTRNKRPGQHFSTQLWMHRYDLFQRLQKQGLDPYYNDELAWSAIEWLKQNWKD